MVVLGVASCFRGLFIKATVIWYFVVVVGKVVLDIAVLLTALLSIASTYANTSDFELYVMIYQKIEDLLILLLLFIFAVSRVR